MRNRLVVIGGSWGGLVALERLLAPLSTGCDAAIVVVLHRSPQGLVHGMESLLSRSLSLPVITVDDKEPLLPGRVYVAPADYHLLVDEGELSLSVEEPVRFSRPSIDVLFESAADSYGESTIAIVLTGANEDGAEGARAVRNAGGVVLVQDPATAERREMPEAAIATGAATAVAPLDDLADLLRQLVTTADAT
jgi:two-component system chemotaxis response regulator CheB